jgi:hypothetical protein
MQNLKLKITVSHNEVNSNFSIMSQPSTMTIELSNDKSKVWNEIKDFNPSIVYVWGQKIWEISHPNTFGKVIKVDVLN